MAQKKIRLKGHETFILREGWLTKGLLAVDADKKVFSDNYGADALGVGTNMAKSIRYWLKSSNLTNESSREGITLTTIGKIIYQQDPYFEDIFSLWIVHANLAMNAENVSTWFAFFNLSESEEFTKEELSAELVRELTEYSGGIVSENSVAADITALVNMYCREKGLNYDPEEKKVSPFAVLGLIKKAMNKYFRTLPSLNLLDPMAVLYLLSIYFETTKEKSVSIDDLLHKWRLPGKIYNLNRVALSHYLDQLSAAGYIIVNQTAGLDMVYQGKVIKPEQVIESYYEKRKTSS